MLDRKIEVNIKSIEVTKGDDAKRAMQKL